ncbi:MAG: hypothetical protein N2689_01640 [Verrucomicrobiae bacterium]|nr:hypothetical protein [Verrucomicrobiae bacterium]
MKRLWKALKRAFFALRLIIWLVGLVVVGAYAYLYFIGVPRALCDRVIRELAARGVAATFDDIKLELPAILVAHNVALADTRTPDRPLVQAQRLGIDFDLASLWRQGLSPVQALEVIDGTLSVPLDFDDPRSERIQAEKVNGHICLSEGNVLEVNHLTAELCRLRFVLDGQLRMAPPRQPPQSKRPPMSAEERARRAQRVRDILGELHSLKFDQPPVLTLRFEAASDDLSAFEADLKIDARALAHPKLAVESLSARLRYAEQRLRLDRLEATLGGGKLKVASADYDLRQHTGRVVAESSVDPKVFQKLLPPQLFQQLAAWRFDRNPRFTLAASYEADRLSIQSFEAQVAGGKLIVSGYYDFKTGEAQADVESHVNLKELAVFMPVGWQRMLAEWRWNKNPDVRFHIYWREASPNLPTITQGRIAISDAAFRGIGIRRGACSGELRNDVLTLSQAVVDLQPPAHQTNLLLTIRGNYTCHMSRQDFSFTELSATAYPMMLAPLYASNAVLVVKEFEPAQPVAVSGWWRGNWQRFETSECAGRLHTGPLGWRGLKTQAADCDFHYARQVLTLQNVVLQRPEGVVKGDYQHHFETSDFTAKLEGTVDLLSLTPILGDAPRQMLARWHPDAPVRLNLQSIRGNWQRLGQASVEGTVETGPISAGSGCAKALEARFTLDPAGINAGRFILKVPSGEVKGRLRFDRLRERLEFTGEKECRFQPIEVAQLFGTNFVAAVSPYRFASTPSLLDLQTVADFKDWNQTTWSTEIVANRLEWWRLQAEDVRARVSFTNRVVTISDFKTGQGEKKNVGFYGGKLEIKRATFDLRQPRMAYDVDLRLDDVKEGGALLRAMFGYDKLSGTFHGNAHVRGKWEDYDSIEGHGDLHLINAQLWSIPLFGGLSQVLGLILPDKLVKTPAKDIHTSFAAAGGYLYLPDPKREGDLLTLRAAPHSITGRGKWRINGEMNFVFQQHFLAEAGPLSPVSKLFDPLTKPFEMELTGTLAQPQWRPRWLVPNIGGSRK